MSPIYHMRDCSSRRSFPAVEPRIGVFVVVEGSCPSIVAVGRSSTVHVLHDAGVHDLAHPEVLQALHHEEVLAPGLPRQLVLAALPAVEVSPDRLHGEDLGRAVHRRVVRGAREQVAVREVDVRARVALQVLPEPVGQQDRVRVDLHGEVVVVVPAVVLDGLPRVHEALGVRGGAVLRDPPLVDDADDPGADARAQVLRVVAQHGLLVAREDASVALPLYLHEVHLGVEAPGDGEAEERWVPPPPTL
mmetsp:Transcript_54757/g.154130  ORF Transcript_54757/g.154130 Transcript_54757/m.154130 type:complete len:247 (+) Transcript_54757:212-952(+)